MSDTTVTKPARVFLSASQYDALKVLAQYVLPGLAALYVALAGLWDLPKALEVAGTVAAVDTFLGFVLGLSKSQFDKSDFKYDGEIAVEPDETGDFSNLNVKLDTDAVQTKKEVLVKINRT